MTQQFRGEQNSFKRNDPNLRKDIMNITALQSKPTAVEVNTRCFHPLSPSKKQGTESIHSTDRNMKFKLDQLEDKLSQLLDDVRSCRQEYREMLDQTALTKNSLVYEDLLKVKTEMEGRMQSFSQQIRLRRQTDEQRYNQIREDCKLIWNSTEELRESVFQLGMRVQQVEEKLGFQEIYRMESY